MEGVSTAKIVLFHQGSTELRRCENYVFFLPVNILTGVTRRLLRPHDTLPCVLIYGNGAMLCGRYLHECLFVWCCCVHFMVLWKMLLWLELGKVGNRARCGGRVVCIARKTLYSRVYFVCTHTKYMVSGDCTPGVCTA